MTPRAVLAAPAKAAPRPVACRRRLARSEPYDWLLRAILLLLAFHVLAGGPDWTAPARLTRPVRTIEQAKYCLQPFWQGTGFVPCREVYAGVQVPL